MSEITGHMVLDCKSYVQEVSRPYVPVASTSHLTLRALYKAYGEDAVDRTIKWIFQSGETL